MLKTCTACSYAHEGDDCPNPGCTANPRVSDSQKSRWAEERAKREADEAERERIRSIRRRFK